MSKPAQGRHLGRVVREQDDPSHPEVVEHGRAGGVLARVDGQAERSLGIDGVGSAVLLRIGAQLVHQPHTTTLMATEVDDHPALSATLAKDACELRAAVAPQGPEGVTGEALGVHPDQGRGRGATRAGRAG